MPLIEKLFPRAVQHLVDAALSAQGSNKAHNAHINDAASIDSQPFGPTLLLGAAGVRIRSSHWKILREIPGKGWVGALSFPGGWKLIREKRNQDGRVSERWVLEKIL